MRILLIILVPVLFILSCKNETNGSKPRGEQKAVDSIKISEENKVVDVEDKKGKSAAKKDIQESKHEKPEVYKEYSNSPSENVHKNPPPVLNEVVQIDEQERKPPLVERRINWTENTVSISYKKKVYPDPNVGCSSSTCVLFIKIPISGQKEKMKFDIVDFLKSEFNYNYSGGLYGEQSNGKPTAGTIVVNQISDEKWEVEISIEFPIKEFGGMEEKERKETFQLEGIFK